MTTKIDIQQLKDGMYAIKVDGVSVGNYDLLYAESIAEMYTEMKVKVNWIYLEDISNSPVNVVI